MEKVSYYNKVYLTPRDSVAVRKEGKNVDWDGLVEEVFKEVVAQFLLESGIQDIKIEDQTNRCYREQQSTSTTKRRMSSSSAMTFKPFLPNNWADPNSHNSRSRQNSSPSSTTGQSWSLKTQSTPPSITTINQSTAQQDWAENMVMLSL
eukprot:GFUD01024536.1.p1 GENE.GFUD01024536.1~~GFUD01024536.1.p1  ORF type:complete len:149 (-),score=42.10 GFUD01024536.1:12-458(-)